MTQQWPEYVLEAFERLQKLNAEKDATIGRMTRLLESFIEETLKQKPWIKSKTPATKKITVYDYGHKELKEKQNPVKYIVDAYCVGGDEGIRAYFIHEDLVYEASGDDGHWWVTGCFHPNWLKELKDSVHNLAAYFIKPTINNDEVRAACLKAKKEKG